MQVSPITGPSETADVRKVPVGPLKLEDAIRPPTNLYTTKAPHTATILSVRQISSPSCADKIYEIIFDHRGFMSYKEGQAFGVMVPNADNPFVPGCAEGLRTIFSASSRYGDYFNGRTTTILVKLNKYDETLRNLCNARRGYHLQLTGPSLEATLLGDYSPTATHIFVAQSGASIGPFRAHIRRFFKEVIPTFKFSGQVWLFYGRKDQPQPDCRIYNDEFEQYQEDYPRNFHYYFYNDILSQNLAGTVINLLTKNGAYIYLVGPHGMVDNADTTFTNIDPHWPIQKPILVEKNQWRVQDDDY
ncbi:ferredoxin--NADP reductase, root isozyme, chloroplastic-like [Humulus lupulus]|uniref:ferredoxin--NADP reductase, root isozyme, chloroplastic-like n=1 Tax=Humulus lupulus TaxID=3486 RepID=UPI002B41007B|nr:ferredoxin--NADP reductase, root isozyme, chloroplastic-like [Humulus lupulus]